MVPIIILLILLAAAGYFAFNVMGKRQSEVTERLNRYIAITKETPSGSLGEMLAKEEKAKENVFDNVDKVIEKKTFSVKIQTELTKADLPLRVSEFITFRFIGFSVLALIGFIFGKIPGMIIGAFLGQMMPSIYVKMIQKKRQKAFNNQIEDALTLISNSLKSGYSFMQAVEMVAREMPPPMSVEFIKVIRETGLGLPVEESLLRLAKRMESDDLDLVITAVLIQRQTGGNLSEILDNISNTIRERIRIKGEIMTLTAMGRLSGGIVSLLPFAIGAILFMISPQFMRPLIDTWLGRGMLALGLVMIGIGIMLIRKFITIEV